MSHHSTPFAADKTAVTTVEVEVAEIKRTTPYGSDASSEEAEMEAKQMGPAAVAAPVPSQEYLRDLERERQRRNALPPLWARATSLVLASLALAFTIATLGLEANMYRMEQYYMDHKEKSDSDNLHALIFLFIAIGFIDCIATIATLVVALVMTAVRPHRVVGAPGSCGRNCFCATICIQACFCALSIAVFATMQYTQSLKYPTPLAVPIVRAVLMFAYFAVLLAAKCM